MKSTPCTITGVYATAHTTVGDFRTEAPSAIRFDCEMAWFDLPIGYVPKCGSIHSVTLHLGTSPVLVAVDPPQRFRKGDRLIIVQPVSFRFDEFDQRGKRPYRGTVEEEI